MLTTGPPTPHRRFLQKFNSFPPIHRRFSLDEPSGSDYGRLTHLFFPFVFSETFEDKRKRNFERGRLELERRRQEMHEQRQKERDEIERKERLEEERKQRAK